MPQINPDPDSDSDDMPPVENLYEQPSNIFSTYGKPTPRNSRGLITYSNKGKQSAVPSDADEHVHSPLIRLGEGIVLDWNMDSYESLFGGTESDSEMRGAPTWETMPVHLDPELARSGSYGPAGGERVSAWVIAWMSSAKKRFFQRMMLGTVQDAKSIGEPARPSSFGSLRHSRHTPKEIQR
jgi:hypothetical protein